MAQAVYKDVRVLDFTQYQQGPVATQMLGDFGAEVIKIERPGSGDGFRGSSATGSLNADLEGGYSKAFIACNRNKKSITVNLKSEKGTQIVHELVKLSDVVVSNFRPGVMERLGLGYDELSQINPGIICAYGTGYGLTGPDRDTLGQDMMAQCRGGLVRGDPPRKVGFNVCDQMGGFLLAMGVMLALAAREKTGKGQIVDSNLLNTAVVADSLAATVYLNSENYPPEPEEKQGSEQDHEPNMPNPTYALYQAADGRWVHIIDAFRDEPLRRQCRALDIPEEVADDPRFQDVHNLSPEAYEELKGILAEAVAKFTAEQVVKRFEKQDMMAVPVNSYRETFQDPQVLHNNMVIEAQHPRAGKMNLVGFPIKLSDTPAELRDPPPLLGEHNEEVLGDLLGMSDEEIETLRDEGVI